MQLQPYLFFGGRCEEAFEFYRKAVGAEMVMLMRFKDSPAPAPEGQCAPGSGDKVMHCEFRVGETRVLASDGQCDGKTKFDGFSLALTVPTAAEGEKLFNALGEGGNVLMPLTQTFFAERFGMVSDKFGLMWMVMAAPKGK